MTEVLKERLLKNGSMGLHVAMKIRRKALSEEGNFFKSKNFMIRGENFKLF